MQQQHGSGKTAVLVERIINKIVKEKIDIDKLLVVTFTNATAAEMRARIMEAIYKYLDEYPEDEHMQKQTILIGKSNICTIHSFCLDVIKNHFYEISISPNFSIAEQSEIELLKQEILEDMFEEKYENEDEEFLKLINIYTNYSNDNILKDIILRIYNYIGGSPFPKEWLQDKIEKFNINNEIDFKQTIWGEILINEFKEEIYSYILELKNIKKNLNKYAELDKYANIILADIEKLQQLYSNLHSWDKAYEISNSIKWDIWPKDSKIELEEKQFAKEKRDNIKKKFNDIKKKILPYDSKQAISDIQDMYPILHAIMNMIIEFENRYATAKNERNIIDFTDIEHFALQILVKKENGKYVPTQVAKEYIDKFDEIAIDEYQDSNLVQEYILSTISKGNNMFMVGDVKQSIYKFRQARPELFIDKYETYKIKEEKQETDNLKIQLFKNFRSRKNILDITNLVFQNIMSKELGDITYDETEYLNLGANYEDNLNCLGKTELLVIDLKEQENDEDIDLEEQNMDNTIIEAKLVANKIQNLINSKYQVYDKKVGYRNIIYKDIVILLRSTSNIAQNYEKALNDLGLPVFSDTSTQYLESTEIQTIMALLKIIDNPMQDIPLVTVLRSQIGNFTDNDLIEIKLKGNNKEQLYFYEALLEAKNKDTKLSVKIDKFLELVQNFRNLKEYLSLDELIWQIYLDTGFYNYVGLMANGAIRQANLKMLFEKAKEYEKASFKGLFNFINFIDRLKISNGDMESAKIIGENENVIRIMSIHKSKGLEFPVVFLCNTGKKFNMQDLNENILLHQDMGFGPKYMDYERKIQYNTLAKVAVSYKSKLETISEEMRILYVALTRAKEKLVITGVSKDLLKDLKKKEDLLSMYKGKNISPNILKTYKSYLDWLELVYLKNKDIIENIMELYTYNKDELINELKLNITEEDSSNIEIKNTNKQNDYLNRILNWKYENLRSTEIEAKTSVTEIKKIQNENIDLKAIKPSLQKPKFINENQKRTNAEIGTLMHMCLQRIDEKKEYNYEKISAEIEEMVRNEIISSLDKDIINIDKILEYTKTDLYKSLQKAKYIYKEQPFYINILASEIYEENINESILVQGVIDLYFIDENDNIILVDYKTDYVKNDEQELIEKYYKQLSIYKRALEEALGKKVYKTYIYSVFLGKSIEIK